MTRPFRKPFRRDEPGQAEKKLAFHAALMGGKPFESYPFRGWSVELYRSISGRGPVLVSAERDGVIVSGEVPDEAAARKMVEQRCVA